MKRHFFLCFAVIGYLLGLVNIAYVVGFLADFGVPKTINSGMPGDLWTSIIINVALVACFGAHHSITARASFKRWWTRWVPPTIERATYLYMTAAMSFIVIFFWQPIPITLWRVDTPLFAWGITGLYLATWGMMFAATFHFGHFGFFGLRQAWDNFRSSTAPAASFTSRYLYALVRHPISVGWMLTPWLTPHMTLGQLVWALTITAYILIVTRFEEADLIEELGEDYRQYQQRVPAFVPGRKQSPDAVQLRAP